MLLKVQSKDYGFLLLRYFLRLHTALRITFKLIIIAYKVLYAYLSDLILYLTLVQYWFSSLFHEHGNPTEPLPRTLFPSSLHGWFILKNQFKCHLFTEASPDPQAKRNPLPLPAGHSSTHHLLHNLLPNLERYLFIFIFSTGV